MRLSLYLNFNSKCLQMLKTTNQNSLSSVPIYNYEDNFFPLSVSILDIVKRRKYTKKSIIRQVH